MPEPQPWLRLARSPTVVPGRITEARQAVEMPLRTLAHLLCMPVQWVEEWEAGQRPVLAGDVEQLVRIFQHPADFYYVPVLEEFDKNRVFFRAPTGGEPE